MSAVNHFDTFDSSCMLKQAEFSPFDDNGGSLVAIAGDNFVVLASDTRLSCGYSIFSRDQSKLFKLSEKTVLGSAGCWCDSLTFARLVKSKMKTYELDHHTILSTSAVSQLISTLMYYQRFFPYYVYNLIAGLDSNGKGLIYTYDVVGHIKMSRYVASGSCRALLQSLLDNQIGHKNMDGKLASVSIPESVALIKDMFVCAAERDIYTGDGIVINIITEGGIQEERFSLRKD